MDSFLVRIVTQSAWREPTSLAQALTKVNAELPSLGAEFRVDHGIWQTGQGLMLEWATSTAVGTSCLVEHFECDRGGVLLFGEITSEEVSISAARFAWETYRARGVIAVHELDGCFSAVIYDAQAAAIHAVSDLIGQRALRMSEHASGYHLSPHDACLVASGAASIDMDTTSSLSCLVLESSLRVHPLLSNVRGLEGHEVLVFNPNANVMTRRLPRLDLAARIDARDRNRQVQCLDEATTRIVESTKTWACSGRTLRCELTAGIDSRASFASVLGAGAAPFVEAVTSGGVDSVDFRTAQRLARLAHVRHSRLSDAVDDTSSFLANGTLRAFVTNGETDCKRAARPLPKWNPDGPIRVEGSSSEMFRGFFYQYAGFSGIAPNDPSSLTNLLLRRRYRRFGKIPVADEQIRRALKQRLLDTFTELVEASLNGNDALDLFERCAHWCSHVKRASWSTSRNPLLVPSAIRLAYTLPPPIGHRSGIHAALIRRHFPAGAKVLINGTRPLSTEGPGLVRGTLRLGLGATHNVIEQTRQRYFYKSKTHSVVQADLFAGALFPTAYDLLTASDSVAGATLGKNGVRRILEEHRARSNQLAVIGYALTQELYFKLLKRLHHMAR